MTPASRALPHAEMDRNDEPLSGRGGASVDADNDWTVSDAHERRGKTCGVVLGSETELGFKAWTLAVACQNTQDWH